MKIGRAVRIARFEARRCPPRQRVGGEGHVRRAASPNQTVTSPRARSPRSYACQCPTRYLFLSLGFTPLDCGDAMAALPRRHGTPEPAPKRIHAPTPIRGR